MNDDTLPHPQGQKLLGDSGETFLRWLYIRKLPRLQLIENEVIYVRQAWQHAAIAIRILANQVNRGRDPLLLCFLEDSDPISRIYTIQE